MNIVLIEPQIPQNTGNIGRLCLATDSHLHLVGPMGFEITHSRLKRAGLDYWKYVNVTTYPDSATFFSTLDQEASSWFFTTKAQKLYFDVRFSAQDWLFFGAETKGLPADLLAKAPERCLKIPLLDNRVRSLNLANSVAATLYEALRQIHFS